MFDIYKKNVIITGAAKGIGKGLARTVLECDARVLIADIDEYNGEQAKEELEDIFGKNRVFFKKFDVTRHKDMIHLWDYANYNLGPVHLLINNAGIFDDSISKNIQVMASAVGEFTEYSIEKMATTEVEPEGARIVNISSYVGLVPIPDTPRVCGYTMAKWAVVGMTRAFESSHPGLKMYTICPWVVNTSLFANKFDNSRLCEKFQKPMMCPKDVGLALIKATLIDKHGAVWMSYADMPLMEIPNLNSILLRVYSKCHTWSKYAGVKMDVINPMRALAVIVLYGLLFIGIGLIFFFNLVDVFRNNC